MNSVSGMDDLRREIDSGIVRQKKALIAALDAEGLAMVDEMRRSCPKKTGALAASITHSITESDHGAVLRMQIGNSAAPYAAHVEYGHGATPPHPFVRPASERHRNDIPQKVSTAIKDSWGEA